MEAHIEGRATRLDGRKDLAETLLRGAKGINGRRSETPPPCHLPSTMSVHNWGPFTLPLWRTSNSCARRSGMRLKASLSNRLLATAFSFDAAFYNGPATSCRSL